MNIKWQTSGDLFLADDIYYLDKFISLITNDLKSGSIVNLRTIKPLAMGTYLFHRSTFEMGSPVG